MVRHGQHFRLCMFVFWGRLDKDEAVDFLDGATLGQLIQILREFSHIFGIDKSGIAHLETITQYRKILEHPLDELKDKVRDIDEKTYTVLKLALEYIERVVCIK